MHTQINCENYLALNLNSKTNSGSSVRAQSEYGGANRSCAIAVWRFWRTDETCVVSSSWPCETPLFEKAGTAAQCGRLWNAPLFSRSCVEGRWRHGLLVVRHAVSLLARGLLALCQFVGFLAISCSVSFYVQILCDCDIWELWILCAVVFSLACCTPLYCIIA